MDEGLRYILDFPDDWAAEKLLVSLLAQWGETDLRGVHDWIKANDEKLPPNRRWLGDVLVELAKVMPQHALDYGLAANEDNLKSYEVPPSGLLSIALLHLTAEEAIRVMEVPSRYDEARKMITGASQKERYGPDFDFSAMGTYLERKEHEGEVHSWSPSSYPGNFVQAWTARDPEGAEAFCRAMNDRPAGTIRGAEFFDYFAALVTPGDRSALEDKMYEVFTDAELDISVDELAFRWIPWLDVQDTLLNVAERLPDETRYEMAQLSLFLFSTIEKDNLEQRCQVALNLIATSEARERSARLAY